MTDNPSLNPQVILASLGISDAQTEPVKGGSDTAIWRVEWQGQLYALRVFRPEQTDTCEAEVLAMQTVAAGGILVPSVIRRGVWESRPVLLLSWVAGKTLAAQLLSKPHLGWTLGRAFGQMQARIHQLSVPAKVESTSWIDWAGDEPELKARLYDLKSRKTRLLHLDYHPQNVMVDGIQVSGVLDWANVHAGDPRADFARTYTILRVEPYGPNGDSLKLAVMRRLLEWAWRSGYVSVGGNPDEMALFYAWAGAAMIRDLGAKIGRSGIWLENQHLDGVRRWRDLWKQRSGIKV